MPEETLLAFAEHGTVSARLSAKADPRDEELLAGFTAQGVDVVELAQGLQDQGVASFDKAWGSLVDRIKQKASIIAASR